MHRPLSALLLSASVAFSGCYSTYIIPKRELAHLDGYDIHKLKTITTVGLGTAQGRGAPPSSPTSRTGW